MASHPSSSGLSLEDLCYSGIMIERNLASFLSEIPNAVPLHSLLLPGTHDTMAFYGWIISQCQSLETPLQVQLQNGIRVLDIRLAKIEGKLIAYHGVYPEKTPFQTILSVVHEFLTSPVSCRETIVMSVKQEDYTSTPPSVFSRLVRAEFASGPGGLDILFLENRIPTLGEVRGKVVLLSRFGGDGAEWENGLEDIGIHPTIWPDSEKDGFTWECKDVHVRTHDWYAIPSFLYVPEKVSLATKFLLQPPTNGNDNNDHGKPDKRDITSTRPTLSLVYTSAASFPFAAPRPVAQGFGWPNWGFGVEGVNSRLGRWVLDALSSSLGQTRTQIESKLFHASDADMKIGIGIDHEKIEFGSLVGNGWMTEPRLRGWVLVDFYNQPEHSLVDLLVECNFRGRRPGEEGW
ncbi:PLC-like phosphodiesterase [Lentinula aff. lateritia]|uniref:PLC-like phosphodiesterase n=1 Tax=Lentinula aff. lateritia TaxID=2804960 RepID=A0ACC1UE73_9AGAR|nr:PLC-like phosphodiesterase [Lentinula aff. lateritia]